MRAGAYTVHQSLTAEAAAVLKLSLVLARRRGHAHVTPLHVAYTLLGAAEPSSSPAPAPRLFATAATSPAYGLLMRACARSRCCQSQSQSQAHPAAQRRALELCFNVALNRLPTAATGNHTPPGSSFAAALLNQPGPTLSNALVAALKRAQANQRRGCCVEPPAPAPQSSSAASAQQQQQQQPMLPTKVELDQLVMSILDDPSVSRVMREAGFSSAAVKTCLEEEDDESAAAAAGMLVGLGNRQYHYHHGSSTLPPPACKEEDVRAILEVMTRWRQGRGRRARANPVVVGDSVSAAEAAAAELLRRVERGDVHGELRGARVLRLRLSHAHVRLMTRADVDAWAADLRRCVAGTDDDAGAGAGLVIYVGDMRWAVDGSDGDGDAIGLAAPSGGGFSPAAHLAAELARLLGELRLRGGAGGRAWAWLVAAASYGTFMRCQRSSLQVTWDLQPVPVSVPVPGGAGGGGGLDLELGLRAGTASPSADGKAAQPAEFPLLDLALAPKAGDGVPMPTLCAECAEHYETEASAVRAKAQGTNLALTFFPGWPQANEPQTSHKDDLMEMKRKWSRLCQLRIHHSQWNQPTRPWPCNANATTSSDGKRNRGPCLSFQEAPTCSFHGTIKINKHQDIKTTLSLLPDSGAETSEGVHRRHESEARPAAAQGPDVAAAKPSDMESVVPLPWLPTGELPLPLPSGDLKRNAESVRMMRSESSSKRWKGSGGGGLDLNLRADDEEEDGGDGSSEDELVPSDLTNDNDGGEAATSGDVTDSLGSHCQASL